MPLNSRQLGEPQTGAAETARHPGAAAEARALERVRSDDPDLPRKNRQHRRLLRTGFLLHVLLLLLLLAGWLAVAFTTDPLPLEQLPATGPASYLLHSLRPYTLWYWFFLGLGDSASLIMCWKQARFSPFLLLSLFLLAAGFFWLGMGMSPAAVVLMYLGILLQLALLLIGIRWKQLSRESDYYPSLIQVRGLREVPRESAHYPVIYLNQLNQPVRRETLAAVTAHYLYSWTQLPDSWQDYQELPLAAVKDLRVDEAQHKVTLLASGAAARVFRSRGLRAINDRRPEQRYKLSWTLADDASWQTLVTLLELYTGLEARQASDIPSYLLLLAPPQGEISYLDSHDDRDIQPAGLRPFRDLEQARQRAEQLRAETPGLQVRVADVDPEVPRLPLPPSAAPRRSGWPGLLAALLLVLLSPLLGSKAGAGAGVAVLLFLTAAAEAWRAPEARRTRRLAVAASLLSTAGLALTLLFYLYHG
ncbi:hypothetical protein HCH52_04930 [Oscillospiraceae bacterium HV4-5-C5C]|nr:hypothetical protein [Oscillospiraceae bacterium HV4-5-C5C]